MLRIILSAVLYIALPFSAHTQTFRVAFWNTENLFAPQNDSLTNDDEFTPQGERHWTFKRYQEKLNGICKTIIALDSPIIIGMAEVESEQVMRDLCMGTSLRRLNYKFVHYDTPDPRGIDNALLYDSHRYRLISSRPLYLGDSNALQHTRHQLLAIGVTDDGDTLVTAICHLPSKLGGGKATHIRNLMARQLRDTLDILRMQHPNAIVIAMGDFNADPYEDAMTKDFGLPCAEWCNLMTDMPEGQGSHKYQGAWSYLDQIIVSTSKHAQYSAHVFCPDFLLTNDARYLGQKPKRTYNGYRYQGGISDHLPVYVDILTIH